MRGELERRVGALGRRGRRAVVAAVIRGEEHFCGCRFPRGRPVDRRSLFEIGSITKAFTGVLLADMVLAGEVALEDPLSRHLPDRRPAWRDREPTLLELATHRSGLPNTPGPMARREFAYAAGFGARDPWAGLTGADYERLVARESPRRAPGTRFRYSSMAVGLLGDALAARAGTTYEDLLAARVLRPLGMGATAVQVPPASREQLMRGHSRRGEPRAPIEDFMPAAGKPALQRGGHAALPRGVSAPAERTSRPRACPCTTASRADRPARLGRARLDDRCAAQWPSGRVAQRRHMGVSQLCRVRSGRRQCCRRVVEHRAKCRPSRVRAVGRGLTRQPRGPSPA